MIGVLIIGIVVVGYFGYMKFYYPKFKAQFEQNEKETTEEWSKNKDEILNEYFSNSNKFELLAKAVENREIIGVISGKIPEDFKSKVFSNLKDVITLTRGVDMSHTYLVTTDSGLHYLAFDGEKCFINEVFNYNHMHNIKAYKDSLTFDYKKEKLKFDIDNESPIAISGYPRFYVHERQKIATANDRSLNYFIREYLAYEPTNNAAYTQSNKAVSFNMDMLKVSPEQSKDFKVREYLVTGFKQKMGII